MSDLRTRLRSPAYRASVTEAQLDADLAQLKTLPKEELLDFLVEMSQDLLAMVEDIPNLILDGLEKDLLTDTASKEVADALMQRLQQA